MNPQIESTLGPEQEKEGSMQAWPNQNQCIAWRIKITLFQTVRRKRQVPWEERTLTDSRLVIITNKRRKIFLKC